MEAVELAASAGLNLDPWQVAVLDAALIEDPDSHRWASMQVGLIVPRQNGKGSILEARELAGLFLFGDRLILHSAHELKTSLEAFRRLLELIENTPDLDRMVQRVVNTNGKEAIELRGGQRIKFVARSKGSGRGLTGDTVILDEAYELSERAIEALIPTMSARPNPQVWFTSSAPLDTEGSAVLRRLCRTGRAGEQGLTFIEFAAPDPDRTTWDAANDADWVDLAAANPGFGIRVTRDFIERVERPMLSVEGFLRERLGIWNPDADHKNRVISPTDWTACLHPTSGPVGRTVFALDVSPDRRSATFSVAAESALGGVHVELVDRPLRGTGMVVATAKDLVTRSGGVVAIAEGSPAWSLEKELTDAGVTVRGVPSREHAQACGSFVDAVTECTIRHLGDDDLNRAVDNAAKKDYGDGAWMWSRRLSPVDISPLVSVCLARWVFLADQPTDAPFILSIGGRT